MTLIPDQLARIYLQGPRQLAERRDARLFYLPALEAEEAQAAALVRAYPVAKLEERVDPETIGHDYHNPNPNKDPVDIFFDARMYTLRLMRLSWSTGQNWLLEVLEEEREGASAQLAFALALQAQKTGQAV